MTATFAEAEQNHFKHVPHDYAKAIDKGHGRIDTRECWTLWREGYLQALRTSVENDLHWTLDVAFREDESRARIGHSAENLAVLRHMALNVLKQEKAAKVGIKTKRLKAGWDETCLLRLLTAP